MLSNSAHYLAASISANTGLGAPALAGVKLDFGRQHMAMAKRCMMLNRRVFPPMVTLSE